MASTSAREGELKTQGVIEAAQDPNSNVKAEDAEKKILDESRKAGVAAYHFDPNASAEDKVAQLRDVCLYPCCHKHELATNLGIQASANTRPHRTHQAATLASDADDGKPSLSAKDLPPASKAGALSAAAVEDEDKKMNGSAKDSGAFDYDRVGWAPRFGIPIPEGVDMDSLMTDQSTWLEERLQDKFFGDWYHNAAIIFFCAFGSYTIAVLGGGLGWLLVILAICATYYRTSIRRLRRRHRDDINRAMQKDRLETDSETLEWINSFLVKFWPIIQPMIGETIITTVDQVLSTAKPPFLEDLRLRDFTLGTKPPRMEHVKTYPKTEEDVVLMDWKFSFTPNDTADMTSRQLKVKINPKIVLEVRIGKGMVSKGLDVIVQDMECTGIMRIKVKLQLGYPFVDRVEICFLERPHFDYVCKPLGGDTFGFDINFIPGLEGFIQEQIHANLGPMMYNPHVFPIEVAKMLAGSPVDQAIGVLQIQFHGAQGLKNPDPLAGTPDPYAVVSIAGRQELGRTKTVQGNSNPKWNETVNVVISSLKDDIHLKVFDYNEIRKDKELGEATFSLDRFEKDDEYENEQLPIMINGRPRGQVQCDMRFFPVLEGTKLDDGTVQDVPESLTGICKFTVENAKELDAEKSVIGQLNPYAVLLLNGKEIHISKKLKRTNNPIWPDATKELLITNRKTAKLGLVIKDDRDLTVDPVIGTYQIKLDDLIELSSKGQEWFRLAGAKSGRAKMSVQWRPVALRGAITGSGYIEPIGVMRLYFKNARELRNVETVGKSDPYARVLLSGIQKGRTVTWKNNLNPDWDEVIYVPVHSAREKLTIEVMDEETVGKDRALGHFEVGLSEYVHQNEDGQYEVHHTKEMVAQTLTSGSGRFVKGIVNFTCSFFPAIPTVDPEEEEDEKEGASINGDAIPGTPTRKSLESSRKSVGSTSAKSNTLRERSNTSGTISSLKTANSATSELQKKLAEGEEEQDETASVKQIPKIRLTEDNLLEYGRFPWWHPGDTSEFLRNMMAY
jgi:Ca2+-dependent lipid-binding protein